MRALWQCITGIASMYAAIHIFLISSFTFPWFFLSPLCLAKVYSYSYAVFFALCSIYSHGSSVPPLTVHVPSSEEALGGPVVVSVILFTVPPSIKLARMTAKTIHDVTYYTAINLNNYSHLDENLVVHLCRLLNWFAVEQTSLIPVYTGKQLNFHP